MHDAQGALIEAPEEAFVYLHGGYGGMLAALEAVLEGRQAGDELRIQVEPEEAFGDYDTTLLRVEPLARYGEGLKVGMEVEEAAADGATRLYTVTDIANGQAVLDGNHPLAGMALRFYLTVLAVRQASAEEIRRGVSLP